MSSIASTKISTTGAASLHGCDEGIQLDYSVAGVPAIIVTGSDTATHATHPKGGIPDRLATLTTRSPKPKLTIQTSFDAYTTSGDTSTPSLTDLSSATSSSASSPSVATDNDDLTVVRTIATHPATTPTPNTASFFKRKPEMKVTGDTELLGEEDWDIDIDDGRWKKRMGCKPRKKSPAGGMDEDW